MNLAELLLAPASPTPDHVAILHDGSSISYSTLRERAVRLAGLLRERGVVPGDRVAILDMNEPAFVYSYLAALHSGAAAVPLNPYAPPAELAKQLGVLDPRVALCGTEFTDLLEDAAGQAGISGVALQAVDNECESLEDHDPTAPVDRDDADLAVLLFTAGTAGPPKAAMLTHGNLSANIRQVLDHPGLTLSPSDVGLAALPFFHVYGLNAVLGIGLAAGSNLVLMGRFDAARGVDLVRRHGVSVLACVPAMFHAFLELEGDAAPADSFLTVRLAVSGAAALSEDEFVGMRDRFGVVVYEGYGLTEASPIVTTSAIGRGEPSPGSIGPPLPGVDVRLVDVDGSDVLPGDPGEIWVRGPTVFPGYWRDAEATARALQDGWLRTGDIAVEDDHGELSLVDRAKDLVIVSGFNVYPAEVEEVLLSHPGVAEAAVVGEPSSDTGEAVIAFVVPSDDRMPTESELIAYCARSLARYKCPTRVEMVDDLPRSFAGKVLRRELRGGDTSTA